MLKSTKEQTKEILKGYFEPFDLEKYWGTSDINYLSSKKAYLGISGDVERYINTHDRVSFYLGSKSRSDTNLLIFYSGTKNKLKSILGVFNVKDTKFRDELDVQDFWKIAFKTSAFKDFQEAFIVKAQYEKENSRLGLTGSILYSIIEDLLDRYAGRLYDAMEKIINNDRYTFYGDVYDYLELMEENYYVIESDLLNYLRKYVR